MVLLQCVILYNHVCLIRVYHQFFKIIMSSKCKPSAAFDSRVNRPSSNNGAFQRGVSIKRKSARISSKPTLDLNKLSREMRKQDFPDAIKLVLTENVRYKIIKCKLNTSGKYDDVLFVDVISNHSDEKISTYITSLYTNAIVKQAAEDGVSLENNPEALIGLKFTYCGEVQSCKGNIYSKLDFCVESEEEDEEEEED